MAASLADLDALLDDLKSRLPQMIVDNPDDGDFWSVFAGAAEVIEYRADEHNYEHVMKRINSMLSEHGRYIATGEIEGT